MATWNPFINPDRVPFDAASQPQDALERLGVALARVELQN